MLRVEYTGFSLKHVREVLLHLPDVLLCIHILYDIVCIYIIFLMWFWSINHCNTGLKERGRTLWVNRQSHKAYFVPHKFFIVPHTWKSRAHKNCIERPNLANLHNFLRAKINATSWYTVLIRLREYFQQLLSLSW